MPALVDIRRRIRSVKNTQQITKAMKMVSAAKLRRAQEAMFAARPYARKMMEVLNSLAVEEVRPFETGLHQWILDNRADLLDRIEKAPKFDNAMADELRAAIGEFKDEFVKDRAAA